MNPADRSIKRVHEIDRNMRALVHVPLSKPATRCPAAHELLAQEKIALAARPRPVAVTPHAGDRVIVWLGIAIAVGLLVVMWMER